MSHPALAPDNTAVVTGGASGIGLAAAQRFARAGMRVAVVDRRAELLDAAAAGLRDAGAEKVLTFDLDVTDRNAIKTLEEDLATHWGGTDILLNNAGIGVASAVLGADAPWDQTLAVNLWGIIDTARAFAPRMAARGRPGAIINTGSKQGITTPPGNPAYNVSKAGVKAFTEAMAHELRNTEGCQISVHLLIPGFVFTDLTGSGRGEKPPSAWTPEETVDFMIERLGVWDFYILCPDNDVTREMDEKRMAWAMGDIIENRPALSRWHPEWSDRFSAYMADD
ncbi:MAG: SDR family oxidoreductase [Pseudomonadota bacterium]